jgi:hypothetical protein
MFDRKIENDAAADRAADHDRFIQHQRFAEGTDGLRIARGRQAIFLAGPTRRRI